MGILSTRTTKTFRFWCQKVLPLVYDDSLSYYEVLCKVVDYMNNVVKDTNAIIEQYEDLKDAIAEIQEFIDNLDTEYLIKIIENVLLKMITVGINNSGYIVYYLPESWKDITFKTTGLDYETELMPEYGHLVLQY